MINQIKNPENAQFLSEIAKKIYGADPFSPVRNRANTMARSAVSVQLRSHNETYHSIGNFFKKDHTSIMHAVKRHTDLVDFDPEYKNYYIKFLNETKRAINKEVYTLESIKLQVEKFNNELIGFNYDVPQITALWNKVIQETLEKTP
jgi:hypothetical protein